MAKRLYVLVALGALLAETAAAQDAQGVLRAAADAMGDPSNVRSIQYSGTGWAAAVGQSYTPNDDWPRFEVTNYTRTIDYETGPQEKNTPAVRATILPGAAEERLCNGNNGGYS